MKSIQTYKTIHNVRGNNGPGALHQPLKDLKFPPDQRLPLSGKHQLKGALDGKTQDEIMGIFRQLANEGKCVILVTHSPDVAREADVVYELSRIARTKPAKA